ncbi:MAG TPA: altronate dehydratase family protein [Sphingomonas sp.]|jgi:altronate hydrolase|nr:altronate dehydratase family protein [Sphingomonas sp.]
MSITATLDVAGVAVPAAIRIDPADNVAVALRPVAAGEAVTAGGRTVIAAHAIDLGHKIALEPIAHGADVRRYGWPIGRATVAIAAGDHVHSHNLVTKLSGEEPYRYDPIPAFPAALTTPRHFAGYVRPDGSVGTRNQIWVLPTVGCVGRTAQRVAVQAGQRLAAPGSGGIKGVSAFFHPFGCSQLGNDLDNTAQILASLACHPNAGGVLLIGLGCEENQLAALIERIPAPHRERLRTVSAQASADEVGDAGRAIAELAEIASGDRRETVSLGALRLGLKCGGSDGFSGLTANPLIGRAADAVTAAGGTALLTEVPELFGAERLLMARARDEAVFASLVTLINGFKRYFLDHGESVSENPSPGNVAGGITTLEEKSLGAVQKGGRSPVADVIRYGERVRGPGLTVLEAPGNDAVSTTALAAAGATLTLFSTGRGTPLGSPVPTMKLASNHGLAARKPGWIDFDAGQVLDEGLDVTTEALLDRVCAIASGEPARNEVNEEKEIAIWKRGVTL